MLTALTDSRAKGTLMCPAREWGQELLASTPSESVCCATSFPLIGLEQGRVAWLDAWRFNEDTIPYALQLLWFEGGPFIVPRPQNALTGKKFFKQGDVDMMLERLWVFKFTKKVSIPKGDLCACQVLRRS